MPSPGGYLKASVFRTECVGATPTVGVSLPERSNTMRELDARQCHRGSPIGL